MHTVAQCSWLDLLRRRPLCWAKGLAGPPAAPWSAPHTHSYSVVIKSRKDAKAECVQHHPMVQNHRTIGNTFSRRFCSTTLCFSLRSGTSPPPAAGGADELAWIQPNDGKHANVCLRMLCACRHSVSCLVLRAVPPGSAAAPDSRNQPGTPTSRVLLLT